MRKQELGTGRIEQSKRHRPRIGGPPPRRIEPAEMSHSRYTLTSIHENFADPAIDSEDTTESDMPELVDAEPLTRSRSEDGLLSIPFTTDRIAQVDARWEIRKKERQLVKTDLRGSSGEQLSMVVTRMSKA